MRHILLVTLTSLGLAASALALVIAGPAHAQEDYMCHVGDSFTGVALNPSTIETPVYYCGNAKTRAWPPTSPRAALPPLIHIQFKRAGTVIKAGDEVTLKGRLYIVNDPHRQMRGYLLQNAEIVKDAALAASSPSPGTEAALRRYIASLENGAPNYADMESRLTWMLYARMPWILSYIRQVGALKSLRFLFTDASGINVYEADFEHGSADWLIMPLSDSGKVVMQGFLPLPANLQSFSAVTYIDPSLPFFGIAP